MQIDSAGRQYLALPEEAFKDQRMSLIAVYTNPTVDRTVWERRRRNDPEVNLKGSTGDMPVGYDLTEIEVPAGQYAYLFCDDVSEMYPSFIAPPSRARTNA